MDETVIKIENLSHRFEDQVALENISFEIKRGDLVAIIGPNGSGKTTLLKILIGILEFSSGKIKVLGKNPNRVVKKIGYVPQKFYFDRHIPISVYEFMAFEKCKEKEHGRRNTKKALEDVGLFDMEKKMLGNLSGGQLQRVMIAKALLHEKEILIFDEPSSGIDVVGEKTIYDLIKEINQKKGTTCIIVSHELNVLNKYANRVLCLNKKMICAGAPESIITPELLKELYGSSVGLYHTH